MTVILTGLRANSELTLGNYLGAILPLVRMQHELTSADRLQLFIPDLHSFVTPIDHTQLYSNTIENARVFLAAGIDPITHDNVIFYRQSHVPAHSEAQWILSCFTGFGEMSRMIQFKEKSANSHDSVSVGLFTYPILQAADILLYSANYVPIGEDQRQHLEITRDIAMRLNNKFDTLAVTVPYTWDKQLEFMQVDAGVKIRSMSNPETKMSKSVVDPRGTILLSDSPVDAAKKIMSATTDSIGAIHWDWDTQPGITNLLQIQYLLSGVAKEEVINQWRDNPQYGDLKKSTAELVQQFLTDFQSKLAHFSDEMIESILAKGESEANNIANVTLNKLQIAVGLRKN